ncbi:ABC transporter ATP-binding protein [bacterium]|jgi:ABC-type lipoprotein export system ATPase subunit|nr:ABC transporter ATP-binding protein [bacterium]
MSIKARHLVKEIGSPPTRIINDISLQIEEGEFVSLTGRSGSGKSSLLYLMSTLDSPSSGLLEIDRKNILQMKKEELNDFRNRSVGFVFQFHYLIAELSALENILMPARKIGLVKSKLDFAHQLLKEFDLENKENRLPRQLSGGEQQRVAIARALIMEPKYIFADEPTGSLDTINSELVMSILHETHQRLKTTIILVTHDPDYAKQANRQIHLVDGRMT